LSGKKSQSIESRVTLPIKTRTFVFKDEKVRTIFYLVYRARTQNTN
jgi:hypothetical protein